MRCLLPEKNIPGISSRIDLMWREPFLGGSAGGVWFVCLSVLGRITKYTQKSHREKQGTGLRL